MIVPSGIAFSNVMVGAFVVAILYFAREIFVPIALAVLLSFALAPLVRILQRLKLPRTLAVMGAVGTPAGAGPVEGIAVGSTAPASRSSLMMPASATSSA